MTSGFAAALKAASRIERLLKIVNFHKLQYYDDDVFYSIIKTTHNDTRIIVDNYLTILGEVRQFEKRTARVNIRELRKKRKKFLLKRIEIRSLCESWSEINNPTTEALYNKKLYKKYFQTLLELFSVGEKAIYSHGWVRKPKSSPMWIIISLYDALEAVGNEKSFPLIASTSEKMMEDIEYTWGKVCKVYEEMRSTVWKEIATRME